MGGVGALRFSPSSDTHTCCESQDWKLPQLSLIRGSLIGCERREREREGRPGALTAYASLTFPTGPDGDYCGGISTHCTKGQGEYAHIHTHTHTHKHTHRHGYLVALSIN